MRLPRFSALRLQPSIAGAPPIDTPRANAPSHAAQDATPARPGYLQRAGYRVRATLMKGLRKMDNGDAGADIPPRDAHTHVNDAISTAVQSGLLCQAQHTAYLRAAENGGGLKVLLECADAIREQAFNTAREASEKIYGSADGRLLDEWLGLSETLSRQRFILLDHLANIHHTQLSLNGIQSELANLKSGEQSDDPLRAKLERVRDTLEQSFESIQIGIAGAIESLVNLVERTDASVKDLNVASHAGTNPAPILPAEVRTCLEDMFGAAEAFRPLPSEQRAAYLQAVADGNGAVALLDYGEKALFDVDKMLRKIECAIPHATDPQTRDDLRALAEKLHRVNQSSDTNSLHHQLRDLAELDKALSGQKAELAHRHQEELYNAERARQNLEVSAIPDPGKLMTAGDELSGLMESHTRRQVAVAERIQFALAYMDEARGKMAQV